jgi:hypothetical protein
LHRRRDEWIGHGKGIKQPLGFLFVYIKTIKLKKIFNSFASVDVSAGRQRVFGKNVLIYILGNKAS